MRRSNPLTKFAKSLLVATSLAGMGAVTLAPSTANAAVPQIRKIAMVDMQRVLNETKHGKKARKDLETSTSAKQRKLDKKRAALEQGQAKLKNLSGEKLMAAQEKLQRDYMEWQSMAMTLQQELAEQESRLLEKIYLNCQGLVQGISKEKGLDLVLVRDETTVLYAQSSLDITADVIKKYDKKFSK
jgi:outer membrane protein